MDFAEKMKGYVGVEPAAIFCLGPDENTSFFKTREPFELMVGKEKFTEELISTWKFWRKALAQGKNRTRFYGSFNTSPVLKNWLGYFIFLVI